MVAPRLSGRMSGMVRRAWLSASHCRTPTQSVYAVITGGLRGHLVTRLSAIAAKELQDVQALLSHIRLTDAADERSSPFAAEDGALITSGAV